MNLSLFSSRFLAILLVLVFAGAAGGCIVVDKPGRSSHAVHKSGKHRHRHCHAKHKHKRNHKAAKCHDHPHGHPHH